MDDIIPAATTAAVDVRAKWKVNLISGTDANGKTITITVPREQAKMSKLIVSMLEDDDDDTAGETEEPTDPEAIPLLDVSPAMLVKVVEFMEHHVHDPMKQIQKPIISNNMRDMVDEWDVNFIDSFDTKNGIFEIVRAANYLEFPSLLDLGIARIAAYIKDKTPEEVRVMLDVPDNMTEAEENAIKENNGWIFGVDDDSEQTNS
jgi:S-phase kinase-associated protein 1